MMNVCDKKVKIGEEARVDDAQSMTDVVPPSAPLKRQQPKKDDHGESEGEVGKRLPILSQVVKKRFHVDLMPFERWVDVFLRHNDYYLAHQQAIEGGISLKEKTSRMESIAKSIANQLVFQVEIQAKLSDDGTQVETLKKQRCELIEELSNLEDGLKELESTLHDLQSRKANSIVDLSAIKLREQELKAMTVIPMENLETCRVLREALNMKASNLRVFGWINFDCLE
uniref:Uncharacterized protein n=1 Tax=Nelumbo nucifera TaxID=4432 RepID=A0A822YCK5_NELNU|nr:TPA_asm: hypothetical protein HUJ06_030719 [Nelumbo nucifera]